jgi:hypothetical protein
MSYYALPQLQEKFKKITISYANCPVQYIGGFANIKDATETTLLIQTGDWFITMEQTSLGDFCPIRASHGMSGTTYNNPFAWFEKKYKKA